MSGIAIIVEYDVEPGSLDEQESRVLASAAKCLKEDGCLRMEVFVPEGQENKLVLSELWRDEAALEVHRNQPGHAEDHAHIDELCVGKNVRRGNLL
ncbi:MAG: putative quinol monooxygenase [Rhodospirillaceae bacterium]|nr:putative quinol monooxygenase [Rhodospirillaceae bacterium]MDD9915730.1 putative quinol monooxygenase [Rhodospirillaceae bacterium]MDD9927347.1 putative quinol monooxygenase [Rhodospirillaceae bacterium]